MENVIVVAADAAAAAEVVSVFVVIVSIAGVVGMTVLHKSDFDQVFHYYSAAVVCRQQLVAVIAAVFQPVVVEFEPTSVVDSRLLHTAVLA